MKISFTNTTTTALSLALLSLSAKADEKQSYAYASPKPEAESKGERMNWSLGIKRPDRLTGALMAETAPAGGGSVALAKKLSNPVAAMISVPFQNNFDWGAGPNQDGFQWKMNIQPVIPVSINDEWNLIIRTIIPIISQRDIAGTPDNPSGTQTGIGDTLMSMWLSPKEPTKSGWILGVGPAMNLKTGSDALLGSGKWGLGPTAIALKQDGPWTYGALVNQIWSVAGDSDRADLNNTFIQPFLSYNTPNAVTYSLNTESSYNWTAEQWTVPINLMVAKLVTIGKQPVQFQIGGRYYADAPENGPKWGMRAAVTLLFPN